MMELLTLKTTEDVMMKLKLPFALTILMATTTALAYENHDDKLKKLSDDFPEFAGVHVEKSGNVVISVKSEKDRLFSANDIEKTPPMTYSFTQSIDDAGETLGMPLMERLKNFYGADRFNPNRVNEEDLLKILSKDLIAAVTTEKYIVVRSVPLSFSELYDMYRGVRTELLDIQGVVGGDISEKNNKITVLISTEVNLTEIKKLFLYYSIPKMAYELKFTKPITYNASLRDVVSPLNGGLQIRNVHNGIDRGSCSTGFVTSIGGIRGFFTASHCTNLRGIVNDGTVFYQGPNVASGTFVGEPLLESQVNQSANCGIRDCWDTDAVFVELEANVSSSEIVLKADSINTGSLVIRTSGGRKSRWKTLLLPQSLIPPVTTVGDAAFKTGRTTGTTSGDVAAICVDINIGFSDRYLCYNEVDPDGASFSAGGDSGSAVLGALNGVEVFPFTYPYSHAARLMGLHVAGNGTQGFYVPIEAIIAEFGILESI